MKTVKLFWQPSCVKCPKAEEVCDELEKEGVKVERYNIADRDGLAESAFYQVLATPTMVIIENDEEVKSWRGEAPSLEEVKKEAAGK